MLSVRRPGLGDVRDSLFRSREPAQPSAVDPLLEDREVAFAIRLKRQTLAVGRPDRKPIASPETEPPRRARFADLVDPDDGIGSIISVEGEASAVVRGAHVGVRSGRRWERRETSFPIADDKLAHVVGALCGTGNIYQGTGSRDIEVGCA